MKSLLSPKNLLGLIFLGLGAVVAFTVFSPEIDEDSQRYGEPDGGTADGDVASFVD